MESTAQSLSASSEQTNNQPWLSYAAYRPNGGHSITGTVVVVPGVYSPQLDNRRDLLVCLPPSYWAGERRYRVIYMQDGQNLFDSATAFGGREWQVDETMGALSAEGIEAIVVGLPHMGDDRVYEYNPFPNFRAGRGEQYLAFLVETVKPLIDTTFRTLPGRTHTGLFGSSMGGLISLAGFFRCRQVFGFVGCMSPAFWYAQGAIYSLVQQAPYSPGRIYLDHGLREPGSARLMYHLLRDQGYRPGVNMVYVRDQGGEHSEAHWARRLPGALRFLLQT